MKRAVATFVVGLVSVMAVPQSLAQTAATVPPACGKAPPATDSARSRPARATLALDGQSEELVTDASFKRKTGTKFMTLVYNATGCEMADNEPEPQRPRIYPAKAGDTIPAGVIALDGSPDIEGSRYIVHLKVSSDSFDPGSYNGFVEIKAPSWLNTARTPVSISRSEDRVWVPLGWGALGAVAGFVLFALVRWFKKNNLSVSGWQLGIAGAVSVVVGAVAAFATNYLNQDVWSTTDNAWAAMVVGFTASTSGVMAALLAAVWNADAVPDGGGGGGDTPATTPPAPEPPAPTTPN